MAARVIRITTENNLFQRVEVLRRNRTKRQRYGEFYVEGVAILTRLVDSGWPIKYLIYAPERRLSKWAQETIARAGAESLLELSLELMDKLSEKQEASELLAIATMPANDLVRIPLRADLAVVVFDRPSNPGNLGTVIRSCDAFGVDGVITTGHGVDLYDPRTIRSSVGSLFVLPVLQVASPRDLETWLHEARRQLSTLQVVGTSAHAERDIAGVDFCRPTVLVIGNETFGLSQGHRALCDIMARIPIQGSATSLNVACATSVCLYEMDRQRRAGRD
jgi:tRNA G18 (ribose-2'-O)-methylase SpoU